MKFITQISDRKYYLHLSNEGSPDMKFFKEDPFVLLIYLDKKNYNQDQIKSMT